MADAHTKTIDLAGKTMIPGLIEAHSHLILYGPMALKRVNLSSPPLGQIRNMKELIDALRERAAATPEGDLVAGLSYDDTTLEEGRHPTRYDLDKVSIDHPVIIQHVSMHFMALNSKALLMAGINKDTPPPTGGVIRKDPRTGEPDGVLEEMAMMLAYAIIPNPDEARRIDLLAQSGSVFLKAGITSCHDAAVAFPGPMGVQDIAVYQKAIAQGVLPIRINMMIEGNALLKQCGGFLTGFGNDRLKIGPAKFIGDGSNQCYSGWFTQTLSRAFQGR